MSDSVIAGKLLRGVLAALLALPTGAAAGLPAARRNVKPQVAEADLSAPKFAPDLEELLAADDDAARAKKTGARTLATRRSEKLAKRVVVDGIVLPSEAVRPEEKQSFIVQLADTASGAGLKAKVAALGGTLRQTHGDLGLVTIEAPRTAMRRLAADGSVAYISPDRPVSSTGHATATTGADQVRALVSGTTLDGRGVGVAVIDSAYVLDNTIFKNASGVMVSQSGQDFNGYSWLTDDGYGHGTHVASLIAGNSAFKGGAYTGIAPGVKLLVLRVLDAGGTGTVSRVVSAIDWCVTNKAAHNIRVINLSLGSTAKDSYLTDPLCLAARRAHNAGIVVVAAAGNNGKNQGGSKIYGGIHSPGIEPSVITVGATNSFGTNVRSDDVVATYSSRGPARSYRVINGVRKYDNLIKPDLVAPGNKLIGGASTQATNDTRNTLMIYFPALAANPDNYVYNSATGTCAGERNGTMFLSGTSMAAPLVAGAAALMIQANPSLTPSLVKAILMYTAQPLAGFNMFEQGAGELNIDGAVRMARLVKTTLPATAGSALLTTTMPSQQSTIAGQAFNWGQGVITNYGFMYGSVLLTQWQPVYGAGAVISDATQSAGGVFSRVSGKTASGVLIKSGALKINSSGVILADGVVVSDGVALADGVIFGDGVALADGVILADGTVLADGTTRADTTIRFGSNGAAQGDNTAGMPVAP
ncbi:MAG: S8 family serine peptidase [Blastocatellia bacterium]